ncbi:MAG: GntR family transcriptional regulator [Actinobacteria bacterium]|nr:GntR family transcriptional regulator [Actinomycetota bacterium]
MSLIERRPLGGPTGRAGLRLDGRAHRLLREEIVLGIRSPGDVVDERAVADQYGVRPGAVRSACNSLARDGLVVPLAEHRHAVAALDPKEVHETYEMRLIVEPAAAGLAAERIEEQTARELRSIVVARPTGPEHGDCLASMKADRYFHVLVAEGSGNAHLVELIEQMFDRMARLIHLTLHGDTREDPVDDHHDLVNAILAGERRNAEEIARHHVRRSRRRLIEALVREHADNEVRASRS